MDNTEKDWKERKYRFNTDVVVIGPFINPETGMYNTYTIPATSPLSPFYEKPSYDFGESIL